MPKTFSFALAVCLVLTGCSQPSARWNTVRSARVDTRDADDPSASYAQHLSGVLKTANVEHKIVTYEYRYRTALREEAIGSRTAVIYRDGKNPDNPWWLMDERLYKPVWLPGEDEGRQVSFYLHRPATVVSTTVIGEGDGKRVIAGPDDSGARGGMIARLDPIRKSERSHFWSSFFRRQPQLVASAEPHNRGAPRATAVPSVPAAADSDARYAVLFRAAHGTRFDPASTLDRRKMEQLLLLTGRRQAGVY